MIDFDDVRLAIEGLKAQGFSVEMVNRGGREIYEVRRNGRGWDLSTSELNYLTREKKINESGLEEIIIRRNGWQKE